MLAAEIQILDLISNISEPNVAITLSLFAVSWMKYKFVKVIFLLHYRIQRSL
jgi:hypothetical protein